MILVSASAIRAVRFLPACCVCVHWPQLGATSQQNCTQCSPGSYSAVLNASSALTCTPCAPFENSLAGAVTCWPGVVSVVASNPPPIIPMISPGDLVTIMFSRSTNAPDVDTFLSFSSPIGSQLLASWSFDARTLTIRVVSLVLDDRSYVDVSATRIGALFVTFNASAGLKDSAGQSQPAVLPEVLVTGDWGIPHTPKFIQTDAYVGAYARDTGHNAGLGVGDSLVLRFDTPCTQLNITTKEEIDAVFKFSSALGTNYTGMWELDGMFAFTGLTITVTSVEFDTLMAPNGAADTLGAAVGALRVTVRRSAGMRSLDESTPPSNATTLVAHGTWGDVPNVTFVPRSQQSVRVLLFPPVTRVAWMVHKYVVQWSPASNFGTIAGTVVVAAALDETGVVVVNGLSVAQGTYLRAAAYVSILYNTEVLSDDLGPFFEYSSAIFTFPPSVADVFVMGASSMSASGEQLVSLRGYYLGLAEDPQYVWASYSNGNDTHVAESCHVVADNAEVQCSTVPGVGHSYVWTLVVDGTATVAPISIRYNVPVVLDVKRVNASSGDGNGLAAAADGYVINGRDFGPLGTVANGAWLTLPSDPRATFYSSSCVVTVFDVELFCQQPDGAGGERRWGRRMA